MLHAISWKVFFESMGLATLFYYGWLVFRFLPVGFLRGLAGKREGTGLPFTEWRKEKEAPGAIGKKDGNQVAGNAAAAGGDAQPGEAKQLALPLPAEQLVVGFVEMKEPAKVAVPEQKDVLGQEEKSLAELAAGLDVELWPIYERSKGMKKEELLFAITLLLDKEEYRPLRGSHLQGPVSEGIFGGLLKHGSVRLDEEEMRGLWIR